MTIIKINPGFLSTNKGKILKNMTDHFEDFNCNGLAEKSSIFNFRPGINISENNDSYNLEFALPGYSKEDVNIKMEDGILKISGTYKEEAVSGNRYNRREFHPGSFERSFIVPESVSTEKVTGSMENGILSINLPIKEELKPKPAREIEIA